MLLLCCLPCCLNRVFCMQSVGGCCGAPANTEWHATRLICQGACLTTTKRACPSLLPSPIKATKAKKPAKGLALFCLFSSLVSLVACFYFLLSSCFVLLSSIFSLLSSIFSLFIFNYVSLLSSLLFSIFPSFLFPTLSVASPSKEAAVGVRACR